MAILGIGVDLVCAPRFALAMERNGERLLKRLFTESERAYCLSKKDPVPHLAARFGVKEAFIKAMGGRRGIRMVEIEVTRHASGRIDLTLHGQAEKKAREKGVRSIYTSIAHDGEYGIGEVILEG